MRAVIFALAFVALPVLSEQAPVPEAVDNATESGWESAKASSSQALQDIWSAGKTSTQAAWDSSKETSQKVWDSSKENSEAAWESSKEKSSELWEKSKEGSQTLWKDLESGSEKAWSEGKQKAQQLLETEPDPTPQQPGDEI